MLPFALPRGVAVAAARVPADTVSVWSRQDAGQQPVTVPVGSLAPAAITGWAAYPLGVAWALREAGYRTGGTAMAFDADLAMGAGLSSSAALECAAALALCELHGLAVPRRELAALASRAENDFAGAPTGIMDQSAALLCQAGHALLLDCQDGGSELVPLDPAAAGLTLLIIDTGARHALTDGRYAERRRDCEAAARALRVSSLRELAGQPEALQQLGDEKLRRRARHVISENQRVLDAVSLLRRGALADTGPLLTRSHVSLRDDFGVSWPEADAAVAAAVTAGAAGARMMGGGFGGSVLALVPDGSREAVRAGVAAAYARRGWPPPEVSEAVPSAGARRVR